MLHILMVETFVFNNSCILIWVLAPSLDSILHEEEGDKNKEWKENNQKKEFFSSL